MDNTQDTQGEMLWDDQAINNVISAYIVLGHTPRGLARRVAYEVRDDMQARIAELEAELEIVSQDAMFQNNEVTRLAALVDEALASNDGLRAEFLQAVAEKEQALAALVDEATQWEDVPVSHLINEFMAGDFQPKQWQVRRRVKGKEGAR
jgi:hypothetical protein